ncbi:MAG: hypothetical protein LUQ50_13815, partial [Methanospirillum sp.]|uniref:hypothetical protein n=1 Tax=Methanospirillum sp. TaxID=45200 RepID=UPI00236B2277
DPRCLITRPSWKSTNKKKEDFEQAGGRILQLNMEEIARWYALTTLIFKIPEGAIQVKDTGGYIRPISEDELYRFIGSEQDFGYPLIPPDYVSDEYKPEEERKKEKSIDEELIITRIRMILCRSIMRILNTSVIRDNLVQEGYDIPHARILEICGRHDDLFIIYPNDKGSQISLRAMCAI